MCCPSTGGGEEIHDGIDSKRNGIVGSEIGPTIGLYVWQYPLRLFHWGMVLSIAVLSFTGYYIHNPYLIAHGSGAYVMGTMRAIV